MADETKEQKFKRLATARANIVIKRINLLANLGNKNAYGYNDAQVEKVFATIQKTLDNAKASFSKRGSDAETIEL